MSIQSSTNTLIIRHDDFKEESFLLKSAHFNHYTVENSDLTEFVIKLEIKEAITRDPELESVFNAVPNLEATAVIKSSDFKLEKGMKIFQEFGYDNEREENLSILYYFQHNSIENLEIEVLEINGSNIKAKVSGVSAINSGNWQEPDAKIIIETTFTRDENLRRSFN